MKDTTRMQEFKRKARKITDAGLHAQVASYAPSSDFHIAAKLELERRAAKRVLFFKDAAIWIALALSLWNAIGPHVY